MNSSPASEHAQADLQGGRQDAAAHHDAAADAAGGSSCGASFPSFPRACTTPSDCVAVEHQINCCGALRALGIRADARAAFEAAESSCRQALPQCECTAFPTEADDGTTAEAGEARVSCLDGQCTSTFAGAAGDVCTPSPAACGGGLSCCYPCGIPDCEYRCEPTCTAGSPACVDGCLLRP